jgi:hypothetical protein
MVAVFEYAPWTIGVNSVGNSTPEFASRKQTFSLHKLTALLSRPN